MAAGRSFVDAPTSYAAAESRVMDVVTPLSSK